MKLFKVKIHAKDAQVAFGILDEHYRMDHHAGFYTSEQICFFDEDEADAFVDEMREHGYLYIDYSRPIWFGKVF